MIEQASNMGENARQRQIVEILTTRGECSVEALSTRLGVSAMTIRRDLADLAAAGKVIRTHGGATAVEQVRFEFDFLGRMRSHEVAKRAIAKAAAQYVEDGQTVMLDSGTTTLALAQQLRGRRRLTLITTSLPIASTLQSAPGVEVLLLGGYLRRNSPDLIGALTELNLENLRADLAFIGADGVDDRGGLYNESLEVGRMLQRMVAGAAAVWAVADSSKIGRTGLMRFGAAADLKGLITDNGISAVQATSLRKAGVNLVIANERSTP